MNIKELREKTGLSQKAFGERLGLSPQSILNYEAGKNVPESIQKLIRFEFEDDLQEKGRLIAKRDNMATPVNLDDLKNLASLEQENISIKKDLEHALETIQLQRKNIQLLEDQVQLYKDKLNLTDNRSKTA